jgi:hypothetical protein
MRLVRLGRRTHVRRDQYQKTTDNFFAETFLFATGFGRIDHEPDAWIPPAL